MSLKMIINDNREPGISYNLCPVSPSFQYNDKKYVNKKYTLKECEKEEILCMISQTTWGTALQNHNKYGLGSEQIKREAIKGDKIPEDIPILTPDINLIAFRFHDKKQMVGFKDKNIFHILWFDRDFSLYNHACVTPNECWETSNNRKHMLKILKPFYEFNNAVLYKGDVLEIGNFEPNFSDLIITSPPYNVGIEYNSNDDVLNYDDYLTFTEKWLRNCYYWSKDSGRLILNIPLDKNKGGQKSVGADITTIAQKVGWKYHSTIIWNEGNISRRTAWGSFMSASAPYVIAPVELILVLYKKDWKKTCGSKVSDITKKEFMDWTNGIWTFNGESKKKIGHPAPFPKELPYRAIKLFSYVDDVVFDPFSGSGTTALTAAMNNRIGVGLDIDNAYCELAKKRISQELNIFKF